MKIIKVILAILVLSAISIIVAEYLPRLSFELDDYRYHWLKSEIFQSEKTPEIVFIGSSQTWCSVVPAIIEKETKYKTVLNFGRNFHGREADYFLIKSLLENKTVKKIFIETPGQENLAMHSYTPYLLSPKDAWEEFRDLGSIWDTVPMSFKVSDILTYDSAFKTSFNKLTSVVAGFSIKSYLKIGQYFLYRNKFNEEIRANHQTQGFHHLDAVLQQSENFKNTNAAEVHIGSSKMPAPAVGSRSNYYLTKIIQLAREHGVEVNFLHTPAYGAALMSDEAFDYYSRLGNVYLPDYDAIYKIRYWRDSLHLYHEGSVIFSQELARLINQGPGASAYYRLYQK